MKNKNKIGKGGVVQTGFFGEIPIGGFTSDTGFTGHSAGETGIGGFAGDTPITN